MFVIEWRVGYRSYYWLQSGGTYLKIALGDVTKISMLTLSQLPYNTLPYVPILKFQVSYSEDDVSYAFLSETNVTSLQYDVSFNYTLPNDFIECAYLRIHIKDVANRTSLFNRETGLRVKEIFGQAPAYTTPISSLKF